MEESNIKELNKIDKALRMARKRIGYLLGKNKPEPNGSKEDKNGKNFNCGK